MNIIFFGSAEFAVPSLKAILAAKHKVSCVVSQPDRQKGRHLHIEGTALKSAAEEAGLKIYQPQDINTAEAAKFLTSFNPDLFAVIAYGQILSPQILDIPQNFALNVHASILPKYRGAAPVNRSIINGDKETGITIIKMTQRMDAGPIILQKIAEINPMDTSLTLEKRLSEIAADLLVVSLELITQNNYNLTEQDEKQASFAPKLKKEDGFIHWEKPAVDIHNLIRGCIDWPGAFTYYKGKLLKIYGAKTIRVSECQSVSKPGEIIEVSREGITVSCGRDNLVIEELQIEGRRRMSVAEFIAGHKVKPADRLGKK